MWNLTKSLLYNSNQNAIIKTDPVWGFAEFPSPGDPKKHLLPVFSDPDESIQNNVDQEEKDENKPLKEYWMPDRFCKVCYGCEEPFTMYRRRHHCRVCGQIFCNNCSSYSIDGALVNANGMVRACKECFEQSENRLELDSKVSKKKPSEKSGKKVELMSPEFNQNDQKLQLRASDHLSSIIHRLVESSDVFPDEKSSWKETILSLVKVVVSSVDPDVRNGDSLDIRPYVKIKVIPGGNMEECGYFDGVVFRKNVSHKQLGANSEKEVPKILLLAGGIEFQRTDNKLASMDTLIEQEEKYMEILVEKIMSLKPDMILVGKSVTRKAQELLCGRNVVVLQNVKPTILERVARLTGAMLLASTDNMIKQYGDECLGTCGNFKLRLIQDDPEKITQPSKNHVLKSRISRASTYAYITGCPQERGCTIVLRGGSRNVLAQIKKIVRFSIAVAYHLRLEVAYYNDRFSELPDYYEFQQQDDESSDIDDDVITEDSLEELKKEENTLIDGLIEQVPKCLNPKERSYLSTSLDIDFCFPSRKELIGTSLFKNKFKPKFDIETHQSLLITSLLMIEGISHPIQKHTADVKGIKYYTKHDIAVGNFIVDNCFQLGRPINKDSRMIDHTLTFVHRHGRIDISIRKIEKPNSPEEDQYTQAEAQNLPIFIYSYCRQCGRTVTPSHVLSDEVWKMSFGKLLEILFYNRSARCSVGGCNHSIHRDHILSFSCENYMAVFEYIPIHPYTLKVRDTMSFPEEFHWSTTLTMLSGLPDKHIALMEDFRLAINVLEKDVIDVLVGRPEDLSLAIADIRLIESELNNLSLTFLQQLLLTYQHFPVQYQDKFMETKLLNLLGDIKLFSDRPNRDTIVNEKIALDLDHQEVNLMAPDVAIIKDVDISTFNAECASKYPMIHFRDTYVSASRWNARIDIIYKFLDSVRNLLLQQSASAIASNHLGNDNEDFDELKKLTPENESLPTAVAYSDKPKETTRASVRFETDSNSMTSDLPNSHEVPLAQPLPSDSFASPNVQAQPLGLNSLYKAALEQSRKNTDKPIDKMSRITKALSRLIAGNKEASADDPNKFYVPLGDFAMARFSLKPGRNGIVIPVNENIYASIIAYSLASEEYYFNLQASMNENSEYEYGETDISNKSTFSETSTYLNKESDKLHRIPSGSNILTRPEKPISVEDKEEDNDMDADEAEDHDELTNTSKAGTNYGLTNLMKNFTDNDEAGPSTNNNSELNPYSNDNNLFNQSSKFSAASNPNNDAEKQTSTSGKFPQASGSIRQSTDQPQYPRSSLVEIENVSPIEKQLTSQHRADIKHRFDDLDDFGNIICKFQCQIFFAKQFEALRSCYFKEEDPSDNYIRSLAMSSRWVAQGGKSGASFAKTMDERFVIKVISEVELRMFLDFAPAYFEYMAKAYFHNLPTVLCKILGIYKVKFHNKETGKKINENIVVMENIFYERKTTKTYDLKGSSRARYVDLLAGKVEYLDEIVTKRKESRNKLSKLTKHYESNEKIVVEDLNKEIEEELRASMKPIERIPQVLMDDNLMEFTRGRPFPLKHRAKLFFHKAVLNDTLFLSIVNVVDYSILVGLDENSQEMVVGIIDYLRQYDIIKKVERMGKGSVGMLTGQAEPTIIQPSQYRKRFTLAMERYFMTVPDKWISYDS